MTKVLETGGAGMLGREVVTQLTATGSGVRMMSRKRQPPNVLPTTELVQADLERGQDEPG